MSYTPYPKASHISIPKFEFGSMLDKTACKLIARFRSIENTDGMHVDVVLNFPNVDVIHVHPDAIDEEINLLHMCVGKSISIDMCTYPVIKDIHIVKMSTLIINSTTIYIEGDFFDQVQCLFVSNGIEQPLPPITVIEKPFITGLITNSAERCKEYLTTNRCAFEEVNCESEQIKGTLLSVPTLENLLHDEMHEKELKTMCKAVFVPRPFKPFCDHFVFLKLYVSDYPRWSC